MSFEKWRIGIIALMLLWACGTARATQLITNLGIFSGDVQSFGMDVNDSGVVVGNSVGNQGSDVFNRTQYHSFIYSSGTITKLFSTSTGIGDEAEAINNNGVVAIDGFGVAYTYSGAGPSQTLPGLSDAYDINDSGVIAGGIRNLAGTWQTLRYTPGSPVANLGNLGTDQHTSPTAINAGGVMVGISTNLSSSRDQAFAVTGAGPIQNLISVPNDQIARASDINDVGTIVGYTSFLHIWAPQAFRYNGSSPLQILPSIPGGTATAYGINASGYVVGAAFINQGFAYHALLWRPDNTLVDLNTWLGQNDPTDAAHWTLQYAQNLNSSGIIVGQGLYTDSSVGLFNVERGFVLDATSLVPEPACCGMLVGMFAILCSQRRRR